MNRLTATAAAWALLSAIATAQDASAPPDGEGGLSADNSGEPGIFSTLFPSFRSEGIFVPESKPQDFSLEQWISPEIEEVARQQGVSVEALLRPPPAAPLTPEQQAALEKQRNWLSLEVERQLRIQRGIYDDQTKQLLGEIRQEARATEGRTDLHTPPSMRSRLEEEFARIRGDKSTSLSDKSQDPDKADKSSVLGKGVQPYKPMISAFSAPLTSKLLGSESPDGDRTDAKDKNKERSSFLSEPGFSISSMALDGRDEFRPGDEQWTNSEGLPEKGPVAFDSVGPYAGMGDDSGTFVDDRSWDPWVAAKDLNAAGKDDDGLSLSLSSTYAADILKEESDASLKAPKPPSAIDQLPAYLRERKAAEAKAPVAPPAPAGPTLREIQLERLSNSRSRVKDPSEDFRR